jgi:resuscitation-promoting factor RpfA
MEKSADAFRTISEVADHLDTPAHVLRFWESRFPQIKPVKRAGGRRYYRPGDVALLEGIKSLLHNEGMTIRGVQKILREQGVRHVAGLAEDPSNEEVALEVALADIDVETPPALDVPAAEEATVTVLQDAVARMRGTATPDITQPSLFDVVTAASDTARPADVPPAPSQPAVARDAESVSVVPTGPTLAARLRVRNVVVARDAVAQLQAIVTRLSALRDRAVAANRPGNR